MTREILVSERAYKAATVFTTLTAVGLMFAGFLFVDRAIGWPSRGNPDPLLVAVGLGFMLSAAGIYVFSLRFKTEEERDG